MKLRLFVVTGSRDEDINIMLNEGYPISDASWEPEHAFSDDGKILADYKKHHHL